MIILGIDPGYGRLGYAVLKKEGREEDLLDYNCIETPASQETPERILTIIKKIESVVKKYKPSVLAIETLYFTKNQKTALKVAEIRGAILYTAAKYKLKIVEYTPLQVKTTVCGYGKADKIQVAKMVKLILKPKKAIKQDDTTDAIAICLTCAANLKN